MSLSTAGARSGRRASQRYSAAAPSSRCSAASASRGIIARSHDRAGVAKVRRDGPDRPKKHGARSTDRSPGLLRIQRRELDDERAERRVEHWRKIAQSACEQCGRHAQPLVVIPGGLSVCCRRSRNRRAQRRGSRSTAVRRRHRGGGTGPPRSRSPSARRGVRRGRLAAARSPRRARRPSAWAAHSARGNGRVRRCGHRSILWGDTLRAGQDAPDSSAIIRSSARRSGISGYRGSCARGKQPAARPADPARVDVSTSGFTRTSCGSPCVTMP